MRISVWSSDVCSSDLIGATQKRQVLDTLLFAGVVGDWCCMSACVVPAALSLRCRVILYLPVCTLGCTRGHGTLWRRSGRSEEHTSELQSLMRISYAVFCLKKKKKPLTLNINKHKTNTKSAHKQTQQTKITTILEYKQT